MSYNRAILLGNVGNDPEIRTDQDGKRWASFSLATSESWTDKQTGEKKETTDWHRITVFNDGICGVIEKYVKKGSKVLVEGKIKTRKYTDNAGIEKYSTEIVLTAFEGQPRLDGECEIGFWHCGELQRREVGKLATPAALEAFNACDWQTYVAMMNMDEEKQRIAA